MKLKAYILLILTLFLAACSTKKNKFLNRNFQGLNSKYNVLYNGNVAIDAGKEKLVDSYRDNFWEVLPIERFTQEDLVLVMEDDDKKDPDFSLAEEKAIKGIQKRSMLIGGAERNPQMDEAHILLGRSRYYQQRFIPALEAFNYVLYKHENSNQIDLAKLWREKTNIRLNNEQLAIDNLTKLLANKNKLKKNIVSEGYAIMAQAYMNLEDIDNAIVCMSKALKDTESKETKGRYLFILAQLNTSLNNTNRADSLYTEIIAMNRSIPRRYFMNAHVQKTLLSDPNKSDTTAWFAKANKLIKDYENNPYYDLLYFQKAWYYEALGQTDKAIVNYKASLANKKEDRVLSAKCYKTLGDIYFEKSKYVTAGQYYDSTLTYLDEKSRAYKSIAKRLDNLADIIKYEGISTYNDSVITLWKLPEAKQIKFIEDYITEIKRKDREEIKRLKKEQKLEDSKTFRSEVLASDYDPIPGGNDLGAPPGLGSKNIAASNETSKSQSKNNARNNPLSAGAQPRASGKGGVFYFYNPVLIENGKTEFKRKWGKRTKGTFWRNSKGNKESNSDENENENENENEKESKKIDDIDENDEKYQVAFYLDQLPTSHEEIDELAKERNFAWYQLGLIYKEKFKEYKKGKDKFVALLSHDPEEKLILPAMYHLYKILELEGNPEMNVWKNKIISEYPDSRYAFVLKNQVDDLNQNPRVVYNNIFKKYQKGQILESKLLLEDAIFKFNGDDIVPKLELLNAQIMARIIGLDAYEKALEDIILNYPSSSESVEAKTLLTDQLPKLRTLNFDKEEPTLWKIVYEWPKEVSSQQEMLQIIETLINNRPDLKLTKSIDVYNQNQKFLVVHQLKTELAAKEIKSLLKDAKEYLLKQDGYVISSENYKVVQAKKFWENYKNKLNP